MDCGGKNCKFGGGNLPQVEMVKQLPSEAQEFFAKHKYFQCAAASPAWIVTWP